MFFRQYVVWGTFSDLPTGFTNERQRKLQELLDKIVKESWKEELEIEDIKIKQVHIFNYLKSVITEK